MHWCMDETLALLAMIPFIGYLFRKLHIWWHTKILHTCHEKHCDDTHAEHPNSLYHSDNWHKPLKVSEEDVTIWDPISQEDVEERFSKDLVKYLYETLADQESNISENEVYWYVNDKAELRVEFRDRVFVHDFNCCEYGWDEVI